MQSCSCRTHFKDASMLLKRSCEKCNHVVVHTIDKPVQHIFYKEQI